MIEHHPHGVTIERRLVAIDKLREQLNLAGQHSLDHKRVVSTLRIPSSESRVPERMHHDTTSTASWPPMPSSRRPGVDAGTNHSPLADRKLYRYTPAARGSRMVQSPASRCIGCGCQLLKLPAIETSPSGASSAAIRISTPPDCALGTGRSGAGDRLSRR